MSNVAKTTHRTWRQIAINKLKWTWIFLTWYILSIGPLYWEWFHAVHQRELQFIEFFYRPLIYACAVIPPLGKLVNAYIDLWVL